MASYKARSHKGLFPVHQEVACRRCGCTGLGWAKSERTGRPYLVQTYVMDGELFGMKTAFHNCEQHRETMRRAGLAFIDADGNRVEAVK